MKRVLGALALVAIVPLGACSASGQSASSPTPAPVGTGDAATYKAAIAEVQAYLDTWVSRGPYAAAASYLVPEEQSSVCAGADWPPGSGSPCGDVPVLLTGAVRSYDAREWKSSDEFTLLVTMDLHFRGDPARWNMAEGANDRFFRFTRPDPASAYRMYVATGP